MSEKIIKILQPFSESYTLDIESITKAITMETYSKVRMRYNFQVLEIEDESIICNLIKTDQKLLESNNPIIAEIQQISSVFGRMYNNIKVRLSNEGKVLDVLNTDLILSKWEETKAEMQKHISGNIDLENSISLNDDIFKDHEKVKIAVQAQEFFSIYFGHFFGKDLPISNKSITAPNLFSTAMLTWKYSVDGHLSRDNDHFNAIIITKGEDSELNIGFNNKAYAQFKEHLNIYNLNAKITEEAEHIYSFEGGKLLKAHIKKEEIADEKQLFIKFNYAMNRD